MTTLELIEVAEGRWLAADCCTAGDLEAAQAVAAEVDRLRLDIEAMLAVAARRGLIAEERGPTETALAQSASRPAGRRVCPQPCARLRGASTTGIK